MIDVLLIATALAVLYILAGYPLALLLFPRRLSPPVRKDLSFRPHVSAIVAVHNGEAFIRRKLEALLSLNYPAALREILVVSDGSTDGTDQIVKSFAERGVRLLRVPRGGKAAALNEAIVRATGEILFFTDVRQTFQPDALAHLVANFADPSVGAVSGELRILNPERAGQQADLNAYWRYELWVRGVHSRMDSMFSTTGCIYAIRRSLAEPIPADTLSDDVVIPQEAFFRGYRVILDSQALAFDYPTAAGREFRRKLRTLAGVWQAYARRPELFTRRNRMWLHFLSHRFARLLLPWALLLFFGTLLALPVSPVRTSLLAAVAAVAYVALLDFVIPGSWLFKRLSSPVRTFVMMNLAAVAAVAVFIVPPIALWRPTQVTAGTSGLAQQAQGTTAQGPLKPT